MSEMKIARFVDINACKSIFSDKSTFVLRSPEYYRRLYETTNGEEGDRYEGCAHTFDGGTAEYTCFLISCWIKLKGDEPTSDEWDIFKENKQNIIAIISSPSKVCEFLNKALETNREHTKRRYPFYPVTHKEVDYKPPNYIDSTNIAKLVPFAKDKKFVNQQEYRFILEYVQHPHIIDSYVFCGGIDYMEKCLANPEIEKEDKERLLRILGCAMAGYGDFTNKKMSEIVANADILFEN